MDNIKLGVSKGCAVCDRKYFARVSNAAKNMQQKRIENSTKNMKQIFKITRCAFILLVIISCNNKKEQNSNKDLKKSKIVFCSFPDTVKINKVIDGKLQYDVSNDDSNITSSRFLVLLLSTSINKELADYDEINNNRLLSYVDSLNTGKFEFKAVFEKKGKQTLNIVIRDHKILKPQKNTPSDKMTLRTSDCLFSKEVYIVD